MDTIVPSILRTVKISQVSDRASCCSISRRSLFVHSLAPVSKMFDAIWLLLRQSEQAYWSGGTVWFPDDIMGGKDELDMNLRSWRLCGQRKKHLCMAVRRRQPYAQRRIGLVDTEKLNSETRPGNGRQRNDKAVTEMIPVFVNYANMLFVKGGGYGHISLMFACAILEEPLQYCALLQS